MQRTDNSRVQRINKQCRYDYNEKYQPPTARTTFNRPPYSQNKTSFQQVLAMFGRYPKGTEIRLKEDYPGEVHIVSGYRPLFDKWYIEFADGKSVCMDRLEELVVEIRS